jgi:cation efflux family protein
LRACADADSSLPWPKDVDHGTNWPTRASDMLSMTYSASYLRSTRSAAPNMDAPADGLRTGRPQPGAKSDRQASTPAVSENSALRRCHDHLQRHRGCDCADWGNAGVLDGLIGFGLDSVIEVSSAAAVAWQFAALDPEAREKVALRVIAFSFFGLAAYVTVDSIRSLYGIGAAQPSIVGIALAAVSLAVMPLLSWGQRRAGRELGSLSAVADSKHTLLCTYLSAVLLVGLLLNATLGWSWADPVAALVIAVVAVREGVEARKGGTCFPSPISANVTD